MKNVKVLIDRLRLRTPASHGYQPLMGEAADAIEALCSNPTPSSSLGGIDPRTGRLIGDHGTALQAIDWVLNYAGIDDRCEAVPFLKSWMEGDLDEWPDFYVWLAARAAAEDTPCSNSGPSREAIDAWLRTNCGAGIPFHEATDQSSMLHGLAYILRQIESTNSYKVHIGQCGPATSALRMALDHFASAALSATATEGE